MSEPDTTMISIRLTEALQRRVEVLAARHQCSRSAIVRRALVELLDREAEQPS